MPGRGQADHVVARAHGRAVDQPVALDDADARGREVELVLAVDTRQLSGLATDQRNSRSPADLGRTLDELCDLLEVDVVRSHVVEQDQRVGAAGDHVVDAVRGHVGAAGAQRSSMAGHHRLRPDRVRRGSQQPMLVQRVETCERPEAARARGLGGCSQPLDDPFGGCERDPGGSVRPVFAHTVTLRGRAERPGGDG